MPVDDGRRRIGEDPFRTPDDEQDPARRFRGRLAAPVTVWTSGPTNAPAGLTVSSVVVAEGEPAQLAGVVGPLTDVWDAINATGRFVVHVLRSGDVELAERFAFRWPGDPFEGLDVAPSAWGPVLTGVPVRAACSLVDASEAGYGLLVLAAIDELHVPAADEPPLAHYRGAYFTVAARPRRPEQPSP